MIIVRNYLVKIYNDLTFKVGSYFNKKDLQNAAKEDNIRHALVISAETLEDITKLAEELVAGLKKLDEDVDKAIDTELQNDTRT